MLRIFRARAGSCLALALALATAACQNAPVTGGNTAAPASNTNAASPAPTAAAANGAGEQPVTLAVLDAFFADENFTQELKSKVGLTDEQVAELRKVAGEERGSLRESEGDDYGGTTSAARQRAEQKIRAALGDAKAQQLFAFARERWAGEGGAAGMTATPDRPNAVPTDTRVVVNAPAYRMDVFENGQLVKTYKVGIGYPEFPLPSGMRKADTLIFNPTWTPPDEPWVEAAGSKVKVGETVPAGSKLNPLGPIKIPIGLPSLIHGGKSPARLGSFASHGCVGLTDAQVREVAVDLARLGGAQLTPDDVKAYGLKKTETKNVKLERPVPVELRYETIVATADGKLHVYRDVYDRGTNTEENLRRVLQAHGVAFESLSEQERAQALDAVRQMAYDATGKPAEGDGVDNSNVVSKPDSGAGNANAKNGNANAKNANASNANAKNANARGAGASAERVTRTVKGQKELTIDIAALAGKGYPVPVNLNPPDAPQKKEGGGKQKEQSTGARKKRA